MTEASRQSTRLSGAQAGALPASPVSGVPVSAGSVPDSQVPGRPCLTGRQSGQPSQPQAWISVFPARPDQVRRARHGLARALGDCPVADDALLCLSELASNAVLHSASRLRGGTFTVRADIHPGHHVRIEVHDRGGTWRQADHADGRLHGLAIVRTLAADSGVRGDEATGWTAWAQLTWPEPA